MKNYTKTSKDYLRKCRICDKKVTNEAELEYFVRDKASKHGRANCCIDCRRTEYNGYDEENREARATKGTELYHTKGWQRNLKSKYGITEDEYNLMLGNASDRIEILENGIKYLQGDN